jgi:hypothetical protein
MEGRNYIILNLSYQEKLCLESKEIASNFLVSYKKDKTLQK